jgi:hypothetical protein
MKINFQADSVDVSKKRVDNSRQVVLTVGEYQIKEIAGLLLVPPEVNIKVSLEIDEN